MQNLKTSSLLAFLREAFRDALQSIHYAGIFCGGIRPPNLIVDPEGKVFIIDFDLAINFRQEYMPDRWNRLALELRAMNDILEETYWYQDIYY